MEYIFPINRKAYSMQGGSFSEIQVFHDQATVKWVYCLIMKTLKILNFKHIDSPYCAVSLILKDAKTIRSGTGYIVEQKSNKLLTLSFRNLSLNLKKITNIKFLLYCLSAFCGMFLSTQFKIICISLFRKYTVPKKIKFSIITQSIK